MTYLAKIQSTIEGITGTAIDAFGRLRVSNTVGIFEGSFKRSLNTHLFTYASSTGGTYVHDADRVACVLSSTSSTGSLAKCRSKRYMRYSPARSQQIFLTGNFFGATTGVRKVFHARDDHNGYYYKLGEDGVLYVGVRSKVSGTVVDTEVAQADWNTDKLDGTGPSGKTLDLTKQQLMILDFTWLGLGHIRFCFNIEGVTYLAHEFRFSNLIGSVYSQTATVPVGAEIENISAATTGTMEFTCAAVLSEGTDINNSGFSETVSNGTTTRAIAGTTAVPVLTLRKKSTALDLPVIINDFMAYCATADELLVEAVLNTTLTGASFVDTASGNCQYDVSATAMTGGTIIYSMYFRGSTSSGSNASFNTSNNPQGSQIYLGSHLDGSSESITISVKSLSGAATAAAVINYAELLV